MRIAAITPVWNEPELIKGCIRSLAPHVEKHIVLVSETPYYGDGIMDNTAEVAEELGAEVITGNWKLDHHQRNLGINLLQDFDWIITADADEMITSYNMQILKRNMERTKHDALSVNHYPYWKDYYHVIKDNFKPIFAVRPNVKFNHIRNVNCIFGQSDACIDHLSWCKPKDILKKITNYAHADEYNPEIWYNTHYKNWKEGELAVFPGDSFRVKEHRLPNELRKLLA